MSPGWKGVCSVVFVFVLVRVSLLLSLEVFGEVRFAAMMSRKGMA